MKHARKIKLVIKSGFARHIGNKPTGIIQQTAGMLDFELNKITDWRMSGPILEKA